MRQGDHIDNTRCCEKHLTIGPTVLLKVLNSDGLEAGTAGLVGLISGQNALARGADGLGCGLQLVVPPKQQVWFASC